MFLQVVKFVLVVFLTITPFAFVDDLQFATPAGSFFLAMIFLSVEEIGAEIEDPFGKKSPPDPKTGVRHIGTHAGARGTGRTHFVNLECVIREIDSMTAAIVANRNGTSRRLLLHHPTYPIHSVCAHS